MALDSLEARPGEPRVVAVGGLMASGKSTVAARLSAELGAELLSADATRQELSDAGVRDAFAPGFSSELYPELLRRAAAVLEEGRPVVLDGSFRSRALRGAARGLARECGVPFCFVECRVDPAQCRARLRRREMAGAPGWLEMFDVFLTSYEPVVELPAAEHLVVDSSDEAPVVSLVRRGP